MAITNNISTDLADLLATHNFDAEMSNSRNNSANAEDATIFKFDFVTQTGRNYGTAVIVISDDSELMLFYGDNLGRGMEPEDKDQWFAFMKELKDFSIRHNFYNFSPKNLNSLKRTMQGMAAIKEGLFEGYYGNRRVSYMGEQTQARLVINHNRTLGEDDKRYRYVESLFIETADQERFRLPFKSLAGGRAMLEHVRQGGRPYDVRGNHITEIVSEMAVLSRFNRAQHRRVYEGVTQELVESAQQYYRNLQETVKQLGGSRGYQAYFETWAPDHVGEAEALVENLRDLFVEQTLDARIEAALPTLAKIQQQGNKMKEAQIFESWINQLSEGTWALPETPEQQEKLNKLMSGELIVGPDATNATELLYDVVGDDELFDILNDLADKSEGRANIWDDSDVQRRLAELGVQTPQSTQAEPADVAQDTAPAVKEGDMAEAFPSKRGGKSRLQDALEDDPDMMGYHAIAALYGNQMWDNDAMGDLVNDLEQANPTPEELQYIILNAELPGRLKSIRFTNTDDVQFGHMDEGDNTATFVEDRELSTMLKYAGVPVKEGVLNDDTRNTWDHLLDRFRHEVEQFKQGSDLDSDLYDALFDYYSQHGAMPYGVAKGRTGDPHSWVSDRLADDLGIKENLIAPQIMPVSEGSCNMTMEGEYCPEHGLMECGSMEEDGGAVGMPYSMGEEQVDEFIDPDTVTHAINALNPVTGAVAGATLGKGIEKAADWYKNRQEKKALAKQQQQTGVAEGNDDPINSNSAMTGSYYEGKETDIQEGDALLARIKSLALLR